MKRTLTYSLVSLVLSSLQLRAEKVFLMNPDIKPKKYPAFSVGVTGLRVGIEEGLVVTVQDTVPSSPADGKFKKGQVVTGVKCGHLMSNPQAM